MTEAQIVDLIVAGIRALPMLVEPLLSVMRPDIRETVRQRLDASHARLEAMTSPRSDVEAAIARDANLRRAKAQAHAETVAQTFHVASTTELVARNLAASSALTAEERVEVGILHRLARAALDGKIAVVTDEAPPFAPSHPED